MSHHDHVTDVSSSPPTNFESDGPISAHHSNAGVDTDHLSHTHPEVDKVTDESHTQFKIDDPQSHSTTNQEAVTVMKGDTTLGHIDQGMVASSNVDTVLTTSQEMVTIGNSDTMLTHTDQDKVTTSNSDVIHTTCTNDANDNTAFSIPAKDQEDDKLPKEAVGYHIERLQEDQELQYDNTLQLTPEIEHPNQDDKVVEDSAETKTVTKDENVTGSNNNTKVEEAIVSITSNQNDEVDTTADEKTENIEQEDTIHPFLPESTKQQDSITNADFTSLFKKCIDDMATRREHQKEMFGDVSPQQKEVTDDQPKELAKETKLIAASTTDIWSTISPCPSKFGAKRIAAAGRILWVIDSKGNTYWFSLDTDLWHTEKQNMEYISSSPSGSVVWGLYKGQSYIRKGITKKLPQGQSWFKVDREVVKLIAVGESCVWTVNQNDKLMCRQGVSTLCPEGFQWQHTQLKANFAKSITFCNDVLWACDKMGTVYALNTADGLSRVRWDTVDGCLLESISLTTGGIVWGVEQQVGTVYFHCSIAPASPCGTRPWWEVSTAQQVVQEPSFAGALANKVTSVVPDAITHRIDSFSSRVTSSLPVSFIKNTFNSFVDQSSGIKKISASSHAVWVLDGKGVIRYCCGIVTGSRYIAVSSLELMKLSLWTQVSAMSTVPLDQGGLVWALRSTKELFCFDKEGAVKQIEYPSLSLVEQVATSTTAVWIVTHKGVYVRDNISKHNPQGTGWTKVDMGTLNDEKIVWLACGKEVVWLVDSTGSISIRVGVHSTPETSLAQAWVGVDSPFAMSQVIVGTEDWMVWACDTHCNVYVRSGIREAFPIGKKWELVPGCKAINLCSSGNYVWVLSPGRELLCRFGVKQDNVMGDYWKCITGNFCHISATLCGQLWVINGNGRLLKRVTHLLKVSEQQHRTTSEIENSDEQDWDVL